MRKSKEEAAQTRRRIVTAAAAEFREHGILATGLHAIAKTKRRQVLGALITLRNKHGELAGNAIVEALGWRHPQFSKHPARPRQAGPAGVRRRGGNARLPLALYARS